MGSTRSILPENIDDIKRKMKKMLGGLAIFLGNYLPLFRDSRTRENADCFMKGLLSPLPRKTAEPIAELWDRERKTIQRFVGEGCWDDALLENRMIREIGDKIGSPKGVLSVDPSAFPKQGKHSVGVDRQWCGNQGKIDNCQVGVFAGYSSPKGHTLVGKRLYLPEEWAKSKRLRRACKIPKTVFFKTKWELADDLIQEVGSRLPHDWITSDSEFGRCQEWRDRLNGRKEQYLLDVPCNTTFHHSISGECLAGTWKVSEYAATLPQEKWVRFEVRKTANGIKYVDAVMVPIFTEKDDGTLRREILVIIRTVEKKPEIKFLLSNAPSNTSLGTLLKVADQHWLIEDCFKRAKGEVGLDQYEVRSWVGWHHHMTLSMLALWFLEIERIRHGTAFFPSDSSNHSLYHCRVPLPKASGLESTGKACVEANAQE